MVLSMVTGEGEAGVTISAPEALCNCSLSAPSPEQEGEDEEEEELRRAWGSEGKSSAVPNKDVASAALVRELESKVDYSVSGSLAAPLFSSAKPFEEGAKSLEELIMVDPIWVAMRAEERLEEYDRAGALAAEKLEVISLQTS